MAIYSSADAEKALKKVCFCLKAKVFHLNAKARTWFEFLLCAMHMYAPIWYT